MNDLCLRSAIDLAGLVRRREVSAREAVSAHIARIEAKQMVLIASRRTVKSSASLIEPGPPKTSDKAPVKKGIRPPNKLDTSRTTAVDVPRSFGRASWSAIE